MITTIIACVITTIVVTLLNHLRVNKVLGYLVGNIEYLNKMVDTILLQIIDFDGEDHAKNIYKNAAKVLFNDSGAPADLIDMYAHSIDTYLENLTGDPKSTDADR